MVKLTPAEVRKMLTTLKMLGDPPSFASEAAHRFFWSSDDHLFMVGPDLGLTIEPNPATDPVPSDDEAFLGASPHG